MSLTTKQNANTQNKQAFSKLLFTGWILVLSPIIFRALKFFSPNINVASAVDSAFYIAVLLVWIKWLCITKESFYESFIELKRDKIIWAVLLVGFILGSKVLGIVVAILLLLKSLILSPLMFAKKFVGDKKDRKKNTNPRGCRSSCFCNGNIIICDI